MAHSKSVYVISVGLLFVLDRPSKAMSMKALISTRPKPAGTWSAQSRPATYPDAVIRLFHAYIWGTRFHIPQGEMLSA